VPHIGECTVEGIKDDVLSELAGKSEEVGPGLTFVAFAACMWLFRLPVRFLVLSLS
jgi:hypothetical protein